MKQDAYLIEYMGFASNMGSARKWRYFRAQMLVEKSIPMRYWDELDAREIGDVIAYLEGTAKGREGKAKRGG